MATDLNMAMPHVVKANILVEHKQLFSSNFVFMPWVSTTELACFVPVGYI